MSNPNDPAHPIHVPADPGWKSSVDRTYTGMTIRQEFVLAAMQGLCASREWVGASDATQLEIEAGIAIHACRIADAALAEEARTRSKA